MDNTVGSLTEEQKSILIGCLLGDGTMRKKRNALLEINHSLNQKALVDWLFSKFSNLVTTKPKSRQGNGSRRAYRFTTRSLPVLTPYYDWFFRKGKKVIPHDLKLTPLTLAVWFMDDGCKSRTSIYLNTQQFSKLEQVGLIALLDDQFGIKSTLNTDKIYLRIRIKVSSVKRFVKLVKPYILEDFRYKFPSVMTP